ncbi:unnamed protein product [Rotaria socialis]
MSLVTLPVEIFYCILDHLDICSILISLRRVCRRLHTITDTYNRYELDLSSIRQRYIKLIASIIRAENIIGLILSNKASINTTFDFFLLHSDIHEFPKLRSLTLNKFTDYDLDCALQTFASCPLNSLSMDVCSGWHDKIAVLVTSAVIQFKLRKLILKNFSYWTQCISWSNDCNLNYLSLEKCTYSQYQMILGNLRYLKTLVIRDCIIDDCDEVIFTSYSQLLSLTINDCHLSMSDIEFLVAQTPSLMYLKICSRWRAFDSAFDGFSWEQFIKINISSLAKFVFFFSCSLHNNDIMGNIDSLIDLFRTPFWLNEKRWFITCDYYIQRKIINLYTTPICIKKVTFYFNHSLTLLAPASQFDGSSHLRMSAVYQY